MRILLISALLLSLSSFTFGDTRIDTTEEGKAAALARGQRIDKSHTQLTATEEPAEKDKVKIDPEKLKTVQPLSMFTGPTVPVTEPVTYSGLNSDLDSASLFSAPPSSAGLSVNSVPEPSSLIIWGTALLCLLPWLRKKFAK